MSRNRRTGKENWREARKTRLACNSLENLWGRRGRPGKKSQLQDEPSHLIMSMATKIAPNARGTHLPGIESDQVS